MPKNSKKSVIVSQPVNGMRALKGMTQVRKVTTVQAEAVTNITNSKNNKIYIEDRIVEMLVKKMMMN
jgi:hypothetical protein